MRSVLSLQIGVGFCEILAPSEVKSCTDKQKLIRLEAFQRSLFWLARCIKGVKTNVTIELR